ncbi:MAG: CvpA family protein [Acholeplasmatales bacterium]|nr:CvpA family protein [Acholeplasmatales bacterium]
MYMGFFGIIDAVVVVLGLIFMFVGYKKGFMSKMATFVCVLVLIGLSIVLCGHMAEMMKDKDMFYSSIYDKIYSGANSAVAEAGESATVKQALSKALNMPEWIVSLFVMSIKDEPAAGIIDTLSEKTTMFIMKAIAFGILFVGMILVLIILKIIAKGLRENKFIRVVDGIFGMALYLFIYLLIVSVFFFVLDILVEKEVISSTTGFIAEDLQLGTTNFSISRWLLKGNLISSIRNVFVK